MRVSGIHSPLPLLLERSLYVIKRSLRFQNPDWEVARSSSLVPVLAVVVVSRLVVKA